MVLVPLSPPDGLRVLPCSISTSLDHVAMLCLKDGGWSRSMIYNVSVEQISLKSLKLPREKHIPGNQLVQSDEALGVT